MKNKQDKIEIIYDGSCPLCQAGVKNFCSNDSEGRIIKINKRVERDHKTALEAEDAKLNVDEGFICQISGQILSRSPSSSTDKRTKHW